MPNAASLLLPLLASVALAQTTHVVSGGGAALQLAIHAAAPGDILDVMPGSYTPVTATRALRISLRSGAAVIVPSQSTFVSAITVSSLPAGEVFVVEGGTVAGITASACAGAIVCNRFANSFGIWGGAFSRIDACTGPVVFQDVDTQSTFGQLFILDSAQVSFVSCALPWVSVTNSNATFADIDIHPYGGVEGMRIVSGSVSITDSRIYGGLAASWPYVDAAILLQGGDVVVTGTTRLSASPPSPLGIKPAIETSGGTVRIDPAVVLIGTPPISGPAVVTFAPIPSLAVARLPGSTNFTVSPTTSPNDLVFTLIGLPAPPLALPWGDAWLDPANPILDVTIAPPSGTWSFTRSLAAVPPLLVLVVQSAALSPAGTIAVSPPVRFVWD